MNFFIFAIYEFFRIARAWYQMNEIGWNIITKIIKKFKEIVNGRYILKSSYIFINQIVYNLKCININVKWLKYIILSSEFSINHHLSNCFQTFSFYRQASNRIHLMWKEMKLCMYREEFEHHFFFHQMQGRKILFMIVIKLTFGRRVVVHNHKWYHMISSGESI